MTDTKNMNLNELSTATRENLESLGYGLRTIQMVNRIWQDLSQFLGGRSETPFQPVSTILGHASIGSTNAYTHIDVDGLFKCASLLHIMRLWEMAFSP